MLTDDTPDGWLALHHASRALGVSRQTVLQKVKRGELRNGPLGQPLLQPLGLLVVVHLSGVSSRTLTFQVDPPCRSCHVPVMCTVPRKTRP
jgi:hypothetical protein